jgi:hypothetical protein
LGLLELALSFLQDVLSSLALGEVLTLALGKSALRLAKRNDGRVRSGPLNRKLAVRVMPTGFVQGAMGCIRTPHRFNDRICTLPLPPQKGVRRLAFSSLAIIGLVSLNLNGVALRR